MAVPQRVLFLFGSETGNSETIANLLFEKATKKNYGKTELQISCLSKFESLKLNAATWPVETLVVFVVSSTGEGDPAQTAEGFWRMMRRRKEADALKGVRFTLLGLGDTNYSSYQGFPTALWKKMIALGAEPFHPRGEADDAVGLEQGVEEWSVGFWPALDKLVLGTEEPPVVTNVNATTEASGTESTTDAGEEGEVNVTAEDSTRPVAIKSCGGDPIPANNKKKYVRKTNANSADDEKLHQNILHAIEPEALSGFHPSHLEKSRNLQPSVLYHSSRLTSPHALKEVLLIKLELTESNEQLLPGDAIGLYPPNPSHEVLPLIERLKLNKDEVVHVNKSLTGVPSHLPESSCTILELFTHFYDVHSLPKRELLKVLAEFASDEKEKSELQSLFSLQDKSNYQREIEAKSPSLLDLLQHYKSSLPPLQRLMLVLPPVKKRWYSQTAFCQKPESSTVEIAMTIVKEDKIAPFKGQKEGLCSHWLKNLLQQNSLLDGDSTERASAPKVTLPIYIRPNQHFRPPEDLSVPIIMIGAGTGIGVFRGFCQHRSAKISQLQGETSIGSALLYFGCRHPEKDYLFEEEWKEFQRRRVLDKVTVSFSRLNEEKVEYIQERLLEHSEELFTLMTTKKAVCYVCGEASGFVSGVKETWLKILQKHTTKALDAPSISSVQETFNLWLSEKRYILDYWNS